jgi:hypothetical protein
MKYLVLVNGVVSAEFSGTPQNYHRAMIMADNLSSYDNMIEVIRKEEE